MIQMASHEYQEYLRKRAGLGASKNKYRNTKTVADGITFDSKAEAERYSALRRMEVAGLISDLKCQVPFELVPAVVIAGKKVRAMLYKSDFTYYQDGKLVVEDVKSAITSKLPVFRAKRHLMMHVHGVEIHEYIRPVRR